MKRKLAILLAMSMAMTMAPTAVWGGEIQAEPQVSEEAEETDSVSLLYDCEILLKGEEEVFDYTGQEIKPEVIVMDYSGDEEKEVPETAYSVEYTNNVDPGAAFVNVVAKEAAMWTLSP